MGKSLIDTNVVIDFLSRKLPRTGWSYVNLEFKKGIHLSVISKIELLSYKVEHRELSVLKDFVSDSKLMPIDDDVVEKAISIGKHRAVKIPDAVIAATALVHNLNLITRNTKDFRQIKDLKITNPWNLA